MLGKLSTKEKLCARVKIDYWRQVINDPHELSNAFNRLPTDIGSNLAAKINPPRVSFRDFAESCDSTFELELLTND